MYKSWLSNSRRNRHWRPRLRLESLESRTAPAFVASLAAAQPPQTQFGTMLNEFNGLLIFQATDPAHGLELWRSDGTPAGTYMIKDILPGTGNSNPTRFTVLNRVGYFRANDGVHGEELWRTDGTEAGTWMVKDIRPGPANSTPGFLTRQPSDPIRTEQFAVIENAIYFTADDGVLGRELWRSDGTEMGTYLVKDINPGPTSTVFFLGTVVDSVLCFKVDYPDDHNELWRTDGTTAGTLLVKYLEVGSSLGFSIASTINGFALFTVTRNSGPGANGQLWRTDGTVANTIALTSLPLQFFVASRSVAENTANGPLELFEVDTPTGSQLWKTDATPAGTMEVAPGLTWSTLEMLGDVGNSFVYFQDSAGSPSQLWRSDGTVGGTFPVFSPAFGGAVYGDRAFFSRNGLDNALWTSDGTISGTRSIQVLPGESTLLPATAARIGNAVFFYVRSAGGSVNDLWRIDEAPTSPPRVLSTRVNDGAAQRSRVTSLTVTFASPVAFVGNPAAAFTLTRDGGGAIAFTAASVVAGGKTVVTLSNFTGTNTQFGSLADGRYTLRALASQIHIEGVPLDGNGNGKPGDDYVFGDSQGLFRLYGDINGDQQVDGADFSAFSYTYASFANQPNYLWFLDINGDGQIDGVEFSQFSGRYNTVLP